MRHQIDALQPKRIATEILSHIRSRQKMIIKLESSTSTAGVANEIDRALAIFGQAWLPFDAG